MRLPARRRSISAVLLAGIVGVNGLAYRHARAFTHFAPHGRRIRPESLTLGEKAKVLVMGAEVPRPENRRTPRDLGLAYERHVFAGSGGVPLEAWLVPCADARGTVVLFHGHAASKDSLLLEARAFHEMGMSSLLVDFYGSGGSGGNETTIGYREAEDVAKAFAYAQSLPRPRPVVLYGASMGAAAVLKGVADAALEPAALILECPFDSLRRTVRHRFTSFGVPPFPLADLLLFWGGVQEGFNTFRFRPVESASHIDRPTLVMSGESDPWVRPDETWAIFDSLKGRKVLKLMEGVGHNSCLRGRPVDWRAAVAGFLETVY